MVIWTVITTFASIVFLLFQSEEVLRFICIGSGLALWHVRDYFPFKIQEFNDTIKYGSFFFFFYSFIIYVGKLLFS